MKSFEHIILTTTMWDEVNEDVGWAREEELRKKYWSTMIMKGSSMCRYYNTPESAWALIQPLVEPAARNHAIALQEEMGEWKKELEHTPNGQALFTRLEELVRMQHHSLNKMRELKQQSGDDTARTKKKLVFRQEYEELRGNLRGTIAQIEMIKPTVAKRQYLLLGLNG